MTMFLKGLKPTQGTAKMKMSFQLFYERHVKNSLFPALEPLSPEARKMGWQTEEKMKSDDDEENA